MTVNYECFELKQKGNKFRIGRRIPEVARGDGYWVQFLYGTYSVNEEGFVEVSYKFRKPWFILFPSLFTFVLTFPLFLLLLFQWIIIGDFQEAIFIVAIFSLIGGFGIFGYSKKAESAYITLLHKICNIK